VDRAGGSAGGAFLDGTVFKVTTNGLLTNIAVLNGTNPANSHQGLTATRKVNGQTTNRARSGSPQTIVRLYWAISAVGRQRIGSSRQPAGDFAFLSCFHLLRPGLVGLS